MTKICMTLRMLFVKFTNYEVDIEDVIEAVRCEMEFVVSYLIDSYVAMYLISVVV